MRKKRYITVREMIGYLEKYTKSDAMRLVSLVDRFSIFRYIKNIFYIHFRRPIKFACFFILDKPAPI